MNLHERNLYYDESMGIHAPLEDGFSSVAISPRSSTSSTASTGGDDDVGGEFKDFLTERDETKKALYMSVVYWSMLAVIVCGCGLISGYIFVGSGYFLFGGLLTFLSGLGFSMGICIASTVPVSQFDIEEQLAQNNKLRLLMSLVPGFFCILVGAGASCIFPYFPSVPTFFFGLWCASHELNLERLNGLKNQYPLISKIAGCFIGINLTFAHTYLSLAWFPEQVATNITGFLVEIAHFSIATNGTYSWAATLESASTLLGLCILFEYRRRLERTKGWTTTVFYATMYQTIFFLLCVGSLFVGVLIPVLTSTSLDSTLWIYCGNTAVSIFPLLLVLIVGKAKTFTLLARYFEYNVLQLQEDGAQMAHLVSNASSKFLSKGGTWWVKRSKEALAHKKIATPDSTHHIQRWFWAKGDILSVKEIKPADTVRGTSLPTAASSQTAIPFIELIVRIDMAADIDENWSASYNKSNVVLKPLSEEAVQNRTFTTHESWRASNFGEKSKKTIADWEPPAMNEKFEAWKEKNSSGPPEAQQVAQKGSLVTSTPTILKVDPETGAVEMQVIIPLRNMDQQQMKKWATDSDNFRAFDWDMRLPDLFSRSPRELSSKVERDALFALSRPRSIVTNADKLAFFVSHSWEDSGDNKYNKVKTFMEKERAVRGHYPTLWLDKVCINQNDTSSAISVLPIIIGGCKRVLVLLSPTYLSRLWCVWELFTLFTFCNNELAMERITVVALQAFDVSSYLAQDSTGTIASVSDAVAMEVRIFELDLKFKDAELKLQQSALSLQTSDETSQQETPNPEETLLGAQKAELYAARKELIAGLFSRIDELQKVMIDRRQQSQQSDAQAADETLRREIFSLQSKMDDAVLDDVMDNFSLDKAHCFDPNEELKLRKVFDMITGSTTVNRIKEMFGLLKGKFKAAIKHLREEEEREEEKARKEKEVRAAKKKAWKDKEAKKKN